MDKKEFRRLYKTLYTSGKTGTSVPAVISEHDLEKISDRVFKAFDADGSGKRKHFNSQSFASPKCVFFL